MGPENRTLHTYVVDGKRLETLRIPARLTDRHTIVLLHEGLGSIAHWKDFPERVAAATGAEVFAYSRYGHGNSDTLAEPRQGSYLHREAEVALPDLLRQAGIQRPVLLGHSDGASIALIYAGRFPDSPVALILEAPHVFVEDVSLQGILRTTLAYKASDLREKLGRYHRDVDSTFWGWNKIWLDAGFRSWNIEPCLASIRCPVLVIQGKDDEYGTSRQVEAIQAGISSAEVLLLDDCKHVPHRDQPQATLSRIRRFLSQIHKSRVTLPPWD